MCYNCGCGNSKDDMGNPQNITDDTFKKASLASNQSSEDAMRNTLLLLQSILKSKEESTS